LWVLPTYDTAYQWTIQNHPFHSHSDAKDLLPVELPGATWVMIPKIGFVLPPSTTPSGTGLYRTNFLIHSERLSTNNDSTRLPEFSTTKKHLSKQYYLPTSDPAVVAFCQPFDIIFIATHTV
jgi:hypothetical protein